MTAKEYVKERMPKARAERHVTNGGEAYWLVREDHKKTMWFAEGKSESNAWVNAKKKIIVIEDNK